MENAKCYEPGGKSKFKSKNSKNVSEEGNV